MQVVARMDYVTKEIQYEECSSALRTEAEWMLTALDKSIAMLQQVSEDLLQEASSTNRQNAMDILAAGTWIGVYERLFALGEEEAFRTVVDRVWDDEPWQFVVSPLATLLNCRLEWAWQVLRQISQNYPDDLVVFCSKFNLYEEWHETPRHPDYLLEVQLCTITENKKEVAQILYCRSTPDEWKDIIIFG